MDLQGVLVSCSPSKRNSERKEDIVCSGILLANKWVLTTGTIMDSSFQEGDSATKHLIHNQLTILPLAMKETLPKFAIIMDDAKPHVSHEVSAPVESGITGGVQDVCNTDHATTSPSGRRRLKARAIAVWRCPMVADGINDILDGWQLTSTEGKQEEPPNAKFLLPIFILLRIEDGQSSGHVNYNDIFSTLMWRLKPPIRGEEVVVESTIFGREFFFNSWSQGIVSSVFGNRGSLFLTDARSALGCEGGPIFSFPDRRSGRSLLGMVLSPLSWWKGEWVGFTVCVALHPIIAQLLHGGVLRSRSPVSVHPGLGLKKSKPQDRVCSPDLTRLVDSSVVLVRCGSAWGSGVVVDMKIGLILTCSHVVSLRDAGVSVWWRGLSLPATMVYRTRSDVAYDLAILRIATPAHMRQVAMSCVGAVRGEPVCAVGFPMFSERDNPRAVPVMSRGVVSHVTMPMVQTTCCVQSGASGGPVMRPSGEMVGIISCNANDLETGALYPHVNMAIPSTVFAEPITRYVQTLDIESLAPLEERNRNVQEIWKFNFSHCKF